MVTSVTCRHCCYIYGITAVTSNSSDNNMVFRQKYAACESLLSPTSRLSQQFRKTAISKELCISVHYTSVRNLGNICDAQ